MEGTDVNSEHQRSIGIADMPISYVRRMLGSLFSSNDKCQGTMRQKNQKCIEHRPHLSEWEIHLEAMEMNPQAWEWHVLVSVVSQSSQSPACFPQAVGLSFHAGKILEAITAQGPG